MQQGSTCEHASNQLAYAIAVHVRSHLDGKTAMRADTPRAAIHLQHYKAAGDSFLTKSVTACKTIVSCELLWHMRQAEATTTDTKCTRHAVRLLQARPAGMFKYACATAALKHSRAQAVHAIVTTAQVIAYVQTE